jgi:hypothetical protein
MIVGRPMKIAALVKFGIQIADASTIAGSGWFYYVADIEVERRRCFVYILRHVSKS